MLFILLFVLPVVPVVNASIHTSWQLLKSNYMFVLGSSCGVFKQNRMWLVYLKFILKLKKKTKTLQHLIKFFISKQPLTDIPTHICFTEMHWQCIKSVKITLCHNEQIWSYVSHQILWGSILMQVSQSCLTLSICDKITHCGCYWHVLTRRQ